MSVDAASAQRRNLPRRLLGDSIARRIFLAVFGGLAAMQLVGFLLFTGERLHVLPLTATGAAEAIVDRAVAAAAAGDGTFATGFAPSGEVIDPPPVHVFREKLMQKAAGRYDLALVEAPFPPGLADSVGGPPLLGAHPLPAEFRLWLRLTTNHRWLVVPLPAELLMRPDILRSLLWWGASLSVAAVLSLLVARRLTAPLRRFSEAAERLGIDIAASAIPETGPAELRAAAAVLNAMQRRITRFVDDRTSLLAAISHDLRTPISRLRLRAEALPANHDRPRLIADLKLMDEMIAATLDFARDADAGEPRCRIDLVSLVESLCEELADLGKTMRYRGPQGLEFTCRPMALGRAVRNLLENAAEYGGGGVAGLAGYPDRVEIEICDRGPGIPTEEQERVFEPFYRLDRARATAHRGTGLGLSIARNIARAHGGDVLLENRKEGGLRAVLRLPRAADGVSPS